jgi:hypothetical protein
LLQEKALLDSKEGEEDLRKWVPISREELVEVYSEYYREIEMKQHEDMKNSLDS